MNKDKEIRLSVKKTLQICVSASLFFLIMGFLFNFSRVLYADRFFMAGIAILLISPVMRIAMLIYGYSKSGEYKFLILSSTVLLLLLTALVL